MICNRRSISILICRDFRIHSMRENQSSNTLHQFIIQEVVPQVPHQALLQVDHHNSHQVEAQEEMFQLITQVKCLLQWTQTMGSRMLQATTQTSNQWACQPTTHLCQHTTQECQLTTQGCSHRQLLKDSLWLSPLEYKTLLTFQPTRFLSQQLTTRLKTQLFHTQLRASLQTQPLMISRQE